MRVIERNEQGKSERKREKVRRGSEIENEVKSVEVS